MKRFLAILALCGLALGGFADVTVSLPSGPMKVWDVASGSPGAPPKDAVSATNGKATVAGSPPIVAAFSESSYLLAFASVRNGKATFTKSEFRFVPELHMLMSKSTLGPGASVGIKAKGYSASASIDQKTGIAVLKAVPAGEVQFSFTSQSDSAQAASGGQASSGVMNLTIKPDKAGVVTLDNPVILNPKSAVASGQSPGPGKASASDESAGGSATSGAGDQSGTSDQSAKSGAADQGSASSGSDATAQTGSGGGKSKGESGWGAWLGKGVQLLLGFLIVGGVVYGLYVLYVRTPKGLADRLRQLGAPVPQDPSTVQSQIDATMGMTPPSQQAPVSPIVLGGGPITPIGTAGTAPAAASAASANSGSVTPHPRLERENGPAIDLAEGTSIVGREDGLQVSLTGESTVSRRHAQLELKGGQLFVTDLGSTNGTFVGGRRIDGETPVSPGDTIQFGSVSLKFES